MKQKRELSLQKIRNAKQILRGLRVFKGIDKDKRMELKGFIDMLDDATLGVETKLGYTKEVYTEQKQHKSFLEDSEKSKVLIENYHIDVEKAIKDFGTIEVSLPLIKINESIFEIKEKDSQDDVTEKLINRNGFLEFEGVIFASAKDDGGEPKKPGG